MKKKSVIKSTELDLMPAKNSKKISKWKMFKALVGATWEDFKTHFKNGGWKKGAMLGVAATALPIVLAGCVVETQAVEVNIQEKDFESAQEIQNFLGDEYNLKQTIKETVDDYVKETYGENAKVISIAVKGTDLFEGNIFVGVKDNGKISLLEIQNNLNASMFEGKTYKADTYEFENNTLKFTQNGENKEIDLNNMTFVYNGETGDLTTVDTTKFENAISGAAKSAIEFASNLSTGLDENQESDVKFLLGQLFEGKTTVANPGISINYNAFENKTVVEIEYINTQNMKFEKTTFKFDGSLIIDGMFNQEEALKQFEENSVEIDTESKQTPTGNFINIYNSEEIKPYIVEIEDENEQGGETSVEIKFNDWNEVFNVFGEENSEIVKDAFDKILTENLFNEQNIKNLFGNDMTLDDIESGKIEVLKWAFETDENNQIVAVNMLGIRNGLLTNKDKRLQNARFVLEKPVSLDMIEGKKNVENITENENIVNINGTVLDFSIFAESLKLASFSWDSRYDFTLAEGENLDLFKLLMPLAVNENTTYSNISVSWSSSTDSEFGTCLGVAIYTFNENTNSYEHWGFVLDDNQESGKTVFERIVDAINKGYVKINQVTNKEMISGDIILEMQDENFVEIAPQTENEME